jgi:hypothetical protein
VSALFDAEDGANRRDSGIEKVAAVNAAWIEDCVTALHALALIRPTVTGDDLHAAVAILGLGAPTHPNAFGAVWKQAQRDGFLRITDRTVLSKRPVAHRHRLPVWESLVFVDEVAS